MSTNTFMNCQKTDIIPSLNKDCTCTSSNGSINTMTSPNWPNMQAGTPPMTAFTSEPDSKLKSDVDLRKVIRDQRDFVFVSDWALPSFKSPNPPNLVPEWLPHLLSWTVPHPILQVNSCNKQNKNKLVSCLTCHTWRSVSMVCRWLLPSCLTKEAQAHISQR